jgi:hypothetical protein
MVAPTLLVAWLRWLLRAFPKSPTGIIFGARREPVRQALCDRDRDRDCELRQGAPEGCLQQGDPEPLFICFFSCF